LDHDFSFRLLDKSSTRRCIALTLGQYICPLIKASPDLQSFETDWELFFLPLLQRVMRSPRSVFYAISFRHPPPNSFFGLMLYNTELRSRQATSFFPPIAGIREQTPPFFTNFQPQSHRSDFLPFTGIPLFSPPSFLVFLYQTHDAARLPLHAFFPSLAHCLLAPHITSSVCRPVLLNLSSQPVALFAFSFSFCVSTRKFYVWPFAPLLSGSPLFSIINFCQVAIPYWFTFFSSFYADQSRPNMIVIAEPR